VSVIKGLLPGVFLAVILAPVSGADPAMDCVVNTVDGEITVVVTMKTPHPAEMLVSTPDGQSLFLRAADIPFQYPKTNDFENLESFTLNRKSRATWFNDWGEPEAELILGPSGTYEVVIAENLETERDNTNLLICEFEIE
jgi:hypothetical protein